MVHFGHQITPQIFPLLCTYILIFKIPKITWPSLCLQVISELAEPRGVAVDWVGKNLYWTDAQIHKIQMATYNGVKTRTVVDKHLDQPHSIAVHPELG